MRNHSTDTLHVKKNIPPPVAAVSITSSYGFPIYTPSIQFTLGDYVSLKVASTGPGRTYVWNTGSTDSVIYEGGNGLHFYTLTDSNGCSTRSLDYQTSALYTPWTRVYYTGKQNEDIFGRMSFLNADTGFVVGVYHNNPQLQRTMDGGYSWTSIEMPASSSPFTDVHFFDLMNGIVLCNYGFFITHDGGITWSYQAVPNTSSTLSMNDLDFYDRTTGYAFGYKSGYLPLVYKTTDGGDTWTQSSNTPYPNSEYNGNYYTGCAVTANTVVYGGVGPNHYDGYVRAEINKSTDGCSNYTEVFNSFPAKQSGWIYDIDFPDANTGYAIEQPNGILKTTNGGNNWTYLTQPSSSNAFYKSHFLDANEGYISGSEGAIFHTTNGGNSWSNESFINPGYILDLAFPKNNVGYGGGHYGSIYKKGDYKIYGFISNPENLPSDSFEVRILIKDDVTEEYTIIAKAHTNKLGYYEASFNASKVYIQIIPDTSYYQTLSAFYFPSSTTLEGAQLITLIPHSQNNYDIIIEDPTTTAIENVVVDTKTSFTIFPNPNDGEFYISNALHINSIELTDLAGNVVANKIITEEGKNITLKHELKDRPNGCYFAIIHTDAATYTTKIFINR